MDELVTRLTLIGGALALAVLGVVVMRARARRSTRQVSATGLATGVYLFTSTACPDCETARRKLTGELGEGAFDEIRWEDEPGIFDQLGVDAVPATMIVADDGTGTLWPGAPDRAIARFGP